MRVHLVCDRIGGDRILQRLARALADETGWTMGLEPNEGAELNYFFPYLMRQKFANFDATPTAAWFTHRDTTLRGKAEIWDSVAASVDLRTVSAKIYYEALCNFVPTALVTVPLDCKKFCPPAQRTKHPLPVVGVSGFCYGGGRKGEALVAKLAASELGQRIKLVASGRGWPVKTICHQQAKMPAFFQGLDILLCPSGIEGIGYPPLEAMACGVPVVLPRGVGIFDELPPVQNIYRYEVDNYEAMEQALETAIKAINDRKGVNQSSLRGAVARFTLGAWVGDHQRAFENLLYGMPEVGALPEWHGQAGIYCVAYGDPSRSCAARLIDSVHKHMPDLPIAVVSDRPIGSEDIFIANKDEDIGGRSVKTKMYDLAPAEWEYVLYLDADTEVVADISFLFQALQDGWEVLCCTNPDRYILARNMVRPDNKHECEELFTMLGTDEVLQLNAGVFAFRRNERTAKLVRTWHEEWQRFGKRDQAALDRALYGNPVRLYVLGSEWNTVVRYTPAEQSAGILHYAMSARRWSGIVRDRLDSPEAWAAVRK